MIAWDVDGERLAREAAGDGVFPLLVQSLLERELRRAMSKSHLTELPLYPEGRPCSRPTTRRVLDYFAPLSSHTLTTSPPTSSTTITTELTPLRRDSCRVGSDFGAVGIRHGRLVRSCSEVRQTLQASRRYGRESRVRSRSSWAKLLTRSRLEAAPCRSGPRLALPCHIEPTPFVIAALLRAFRL